MAVKGQRASFLGEDPMLLATLQRRLSPLRALSGKTRLSRRTLAVSSARRRELRSWNPFVAGLLPEPRPSTKNRKQNEHFPPVQIRICKLGFVMVMILILFYSSFVIFDFCAFVTLTAHVCRVSSLFFRSFVFPVLCFSECRFCVFRKMFRSASYSSD